MTGTGPGPLEQRARGGWGGSPRDFPFVEEEISLKGLTNPELTEVTIRDHPFSTAVIAEFLVETSSNLDALRRESSKLVADQNFPVFSRFSQIPCIFVSVHATLNYVWRVSYHHPLVCQKTSQSNSIDRESNFRSSSAATNKLR